MNRHYARVIALQSLFEYDFRNSGNPEDIFARHLENIHDTDEKENSDFAKDILTKTTANIADIDRQIVEVAPDWPIEQVAPIDRNILRLAVCELDNFDTPPKVVINEAIELGKTFGSETSSKFINGVLGTIYRNGPKFKEEDETEN